MAMTRVTVDGKTLNKRTADMLRRAEQRTGLDLWVVQGSYNKGVTQSAGTHDGGGVIDLSVRGFTLNQIRDIVWQMRKVGFAAWYRPERPGVWGPHIHACAIGDKEMSPEGRAQVAEYYAGDDGLAGSGNDPSPRPEPIPVWPVPLPDLSLATAVKQFTTDTVRKTAATSRIQRMLNRRLNLDLVIDGKAGPKTRAAYKQWENKIDAPSVDGVPGHASLSKLVAGFYRVTK